MIEFWVDPSPYFKPIFLGKRQTLCLSLRLGLAVSIECRNTAEWALKPHAEKWLSDWVKQVARQAVE